MKWQFLINNIYVLWIVLLYYVWLYIQNTIWLNGKKFDPFHFMTCLSYKLHASTWSIILYRAVIHPQFWFLIWNSTDFISFAANAAHAFMKNNSWNTNFLYNCPLVTPVDTVKYCKKWRATVNVQIGRLSVLPPEVQVICWFSVAVTCFLMKMTHNANKLQMVELLNIPAVFPLELIKMIESITRGSQPNI